MRYNFYFIFFNAYWTSFDLGEKRIPRQNANYYMLLVMLFTYSGILFNLVAFEIVHCNMKWPLLAGGAGILGIEWILLSESIFRKRFESYAFIREFSRKRRLFIFFTVLALTALFNIVGAFAFAILGTD